MVAAGILPGPLASTRLQSVRRSPSREGAVLMRLCFLGLVKARPDDLFDGFCPSDCISCRRLPRDPLPSERTIAAGACAATWKELMSGKGAMVGSERLAFVEVESPLPPVRSGLCRHNRMLPTTPARAIAMMVTRAFLPDLGPCQRVLGAITSAPIVAVRATGRGDDRLRLRVTATLDSLSISMFLNHKTV